MYSDGSKYEGEMSEGLREGRGTLILKDGTCYIGDFVKDKFHGKGK